ncbi:MAG: DUF3048 domain-containing protein [Patescibacteria group bacterium]
MDEQENKKLSLKEKIRFFFKNPKKRLIFIIITCLVVIIAASATGFYFLRFKKEGTTVKPPEVNTDQTTNGNEEMTLYEAPLDGIMTDKTSAERHPLAISVENDPAARPQSGLDKASIIYETVYDPAATTRYLAVYATNEAEKVGPVRSIRTFFVDWAHGYNAYLGHWGGNIDALDKIIAEKAPDLDEFRYANAYWREYGAGVSLDHTGYTSTLKLRDQAAKNNYPTANNFTRYKFKDDAEDKTTLPESQKISVNFSNASYMVSFQYDKATNSYKKNLAGKPHIDKISKNQLSPKNIIVMNVKRSKTVTRINEPGYTMETIGTGKAQFFMDGTEITGTWKKTSTADREVFYDSNGQEITFNRGQTWICILPPGVDAQVE